MSPAAKTVRMIRGEREAPLFASLGRVQPGDLYDMRSGVDYGLQLGWRFPPGEEPVPCEHCGGTFYPSARHEPSNYPNGNPNSTTNEGA